MKFNTRTLTKHIIPLFLEITTLTNETKVWLPPETQGTKTVARNVYPSGGFMENPNEMKHGFAVRNATAVVAKHLWGIELEISEKGN
jgi:hypothetical protein